MRKRVLTGVERWLNRKQANVTSGWVRRHDFEIDADLRRFTFCNVRIGEDIRSLSALGPPDELVHGTHIWSELGFTLRFSSDFRLTAFELIRGPRLMLRTQTEIFKGNTYFNGDPVQLNTESDYEVLSKLYGDPFLTHEGDDTALFYEFGDIEVVLCADSTENNVLALHTIIIQSPPILADPKQSKWYGLSKPLAK